jgi:hypothetical protein
VVSRSFDKAAPAWLSSARKPNLGEGKSMTASIPAAIVAAALIVGVSIALTSHWSIVPTGSLVGAFRLNHWTGEVTWCETLGSELEPPELRSKMKGRGPRPRLVAPP